MQVTTYLASLFTLVALVTSLPAEDATSVNIEFGLRLIKTSENDPGTWVSDEDKITEYFAKGIKFIDITDIEDEAVLRRLSIKPDIHTGQHVLASKITYPHAVSHQEEADALIAKVSVPELQGWLQNLTSFHNRYYKSKFGIEAAAWLFDTIEYVASANPAITVHEMANPGFHQPNIIARIPGSSSNIVVAGAHFDSTGGSSTARAPGADDNGSGTIVVLEALRVLASSGYTPQNTLEFHFYAGEEAGLLGSQTVFDHYRKAHKPIIAFLNQDQAGYSPSGKISVWNDYSDFGLNLFTKKVVVAYGGGSYTTDTCGYACSDHASAYINGFPAVYVCDEPNDTSDPYVHSAKDAYKTVEWDTVKRHAKFTVGFMVEGSYF